MDPASAAVPRREIHVAAFEIWFFFAGSLLAGHVVQLAQLAQFMPCVRERKQW